MPDEQPKSASLMKKLNNLLPIPVSEKIFFANNLRVMVKSGLSLSEAVNTLGLQTSNQHFKFVLNTVKEGIEKGQTLSENLKKYPNIFNDFFTNMIAAGEVSGNLEKSLSELSIQMQKDHALTSKIKGAMIYPGVILTATIGIVWGVLTYVVPSIVSIFKDMTIELPITTRIVIATSQLLTNYGILVGVGLLFFITAFFYLIKHQLRHAWHNLLIHLPIIGPIVKKINLARFSRTLSSLLETDVPVVNSFEITASVLNNVLYKEAATKIAEEIKKGVAIADTLQFYPKLFSPLVVQMVSVGEKSGTIDELLRELAIFYEGEVDTVTSSLSSIIEPILIIFLGGVVGGIALAIMTPIFALSQQQY